LLSNPPVRLGYAAGLFDFSSGTDDGAQRNGCHSHRNRQPGTQERQVEKFSQIGISWWTDRAGGLEAFKAFFANVPADSELAFVLVQHLAPDHESMLAELLSRVTAVPVLDAVDGVRVEPRHVYVIPPNATLTIVDGFLQVRRPAPPREQRWPINTFFISLAQDQGDRAVCVVLAGYRQ
jgi:chemotaxis response regulator CheB